MSSRLHLFAGICLLSAVSLCLADAALDEAQREFDQAQCKETEAEQQLSRAKQLVDSNRTDHLTLTTTLNQATDQLRETEHKLDSLKQAAKSDQDKYEKYKVDQNVAVRDLADRKKESINKDHDLEAAKKDATLKFEKDPATVELRDKIEERKSNVDTQINRVDTALRKTEPYGKLRREADAAQIALKQLRETPGTDSQTLMFANQKWMDARSKADIELDKACKNDAQYNDAVDTLRDSKKALADATSAFKKSLPDQPQIVILIQAADQSKADVIKSDLAKKKVDADLRVAESERNKSTYAYQTAISDVDSLKQKVQQATTDLRANEADRSSLERDVQVALAELQEANAKLQRARQKLAMVQQNQKRN